MVKVCVSLNEKKTPFLSFKMFSATLKFKRPLNVFAWVLTSHFQLFNCLSCLHKSIASPLFANCVLRCQFQCCFHNGNKILSLHIPCKLSYWQCASFRVVNKMIKIDSATLKRCRKGLFFYCQTRLGDDEHCSRIVWFESFWNRDYCLPSKPNSCSKYLLKICL